MSKLDISIPHQLSQDQAAERIKKLLSNLQQQHKDMINNVSEQWSGNECRFAFTVKGFDITGHIFVGVDRVLISGNLPVLLSFFKGKIGDIITEKAGELLTANG